MQLPGGYALHRGSGKYQLSIWLITGIREQGEIVDQPGLACSLPITGIINNRYRLGTVRLTPLFIKQSGLAVTKNPLLQPSGPTINVSSRARPPHATGRSSPSRARPSHATGRSSPSRRYCSQAPSNFLPAVPHLQPVSALQHGPAIDRPHLFQEFFKFSSGPPPLPLRPDECFPSQVVGATVAERLARSLPTKANRVQYPAGSPGFRKWELCRTIPLVGGSSRGSPGFPHKLPLLIMAAMSSEPRVSDSMLVNRAVSEMDAKLHMNVMAWQVWTQRPVIPVRWSTDYRHDQEPECWDCVVDEIPSVFGSLPPLSRRLIMLLRDEAAERAPVGRTGTRRVPLYFCLRYTCHSGNPIRGMYSFYDVTVTASCSGNKKVLCGGVASHQGDSGSVNGGVSPEFDTRETCRTLPFVICSTYPRPSRPVLRSTSPPWTLAAQNYPDLPSRKRSGEDRLHVVLELKETHSQRVVFTDDDVRARSCSCSYKEFYLRTAKLSRDGASTVRDVAVSSLLANVEVIGLGSISAIPSGAVVNLRTGIQEGMGSNPDPAVLTSEKQTASAEAGDCIRPPYLIAVFDFAIFDVHDFDIEVAVILFPPLLLLPPLTLQWNACKRSKSGSAPYRLATLNLLDIIRTRILQNESRMDEARALIELCSILSNMGWRIMQERVKWEHPEKPRRESSLYFPGVRAVRCLWDYCCLFANWVQFPVGLLPDFLSRENRAGRYGWSAGFIGGTPPPPPLYSGAAPYSPLFYTLVRSQDLDVKSRPSLFTTFFRTPVAPSHCDQSYRSFPPTSRSATARLPPRPHGFYSRRGRPGFSHVRIVPDDATGRRVFSGSSRFSRSYIPALLHTHLASPSSTLKTSMSSGRPRQLIEERWKCYFWSGVSLNLLGLPVYRTSGSFPPYLHACTALLPLASPPQAPWSTHPTLQNFHLSLTTGASSSRAECWA
ncbi:hypothetical protein PR048_027586 [Dryococelus australis]|uniref:Uncharacterized protein n=1 Tax=Dryococelus australis TaxID=614101 RepID=A0ABQ9GGX2_9NEOP|nr:hypothetical protein PR048_027586 [Dryococelus australis]